MFRQRKMFAPWLRKPGCSGLPAFPEGACRACLKTGRGCLRKVSFVPERSGDESRNEQAQALADYVVGKTADEVLGIAVDEATKPAEADLASSVTISIGGFQALLEKLR